MYSIERSENGGVKVIDDYGAVALIPDLSWTMIEQYLDDAREVKKKLWLEKEIEAAKIHIRKTLSGKDAEIIDGPAPGPINPDTGQHKDYWVLPEEERAKGFVRPYRESYRHEKCGHTTTMNPAIAATYSRNPKYYSATFCVHCRNHFNVGANGEFVWLDGSKVGT